MKTNTSVCPEPRVSEGNRQFLGETALLPPLPVPEEKGEERGEERSGEEKGEERRGEEKEEGEEEGK